MPNVPQTEEQANEQRYPHADFENSMWFSKFGMRINEKGELYSGKRWTNLFFLISI